MGVSYKRSFLAPHLPQEATGPSTLPGTLWRDFRGSLPLFLSIPYRFLWVHRKYKSPQRRFKQLTAWIEG